MAGNIITLLTDFGMTDYFVPAMRRCHSDDQL
jgi:S-adenosylmethionine hydrolase